MRDSAVIGRRVLLYVLHHEEHFVKLRIQTVRWVTCLLLTGLFVSPGCGDPQYGTISVKPKDSTNPAPVKSRARKDLPKNQFNPETLKSDKLRNE